MAEVSFGLTGATDLFQLDFNRRRLRAPASDDSRRRVSVILNKRRPHKPAITISTVSSSGCALFAEHCEICRRSVRTTINLHIVKKKILVSVMSLFIEFRDCVMTK
ncbi:MAG TPA: hypothetical protein VF604_18770 [Pyrinomonadaceae bacterium]